MFNINENDNAIDELTFSPLVNLEELTIRRSTNLRHLRRNMFLGLNKLKVLNLGTNGICEIDDFAFDTLTNLNVLYLDNNELTNKFKSNIFEGLDELKWFSIGTVNYINAFIFVCVRLN